MLCVCVVVIIPCDIVRRAGQIPCVAVGNEAGVIKCKCFAVVVGIRHAAGDNTAVNIHGKACGIRAVDLAEGSAVINNTADVDREACSVAVCAGRDDLEFIKFSSSIRRCQIGLGVVCGGDKAVEHTSVFGCIDAYRKACGVAARCGGLDGALADDVGVLNVAVGIEGEA